VVNQCQVLENVRSIPSQEPGAPDGSSSAGGTFMQQQLTTPAPQDVYYTSRSEALHNVEATIVELGGIFQQLAHMVRALMTRCASIAYRPPSIPSCHIRRSRKTAWTCLQDILSRALHGRTGM